MTKFLITGASGRIASNFLNNLDSLISRNDELHVLQNKNPIDLSEVHARKLYSFSSLPLSKEYDVAFHIAGNIHTPRGDATKNKDNYPEFERDNIDLTKRVCNSAKHVIFASTDNVFSGMDNRDYKESDEVNPPSNFYGRTKAIAEKVVLDNSGAVVRFQSPIGISSNLIIDKVFAAIDGKQSWPFWNDQYVRPALFDDILRVFKLSYQTNQNDIFHVSCSGEAPSRAGIANKVLEVFKNYNLPSRIDKIEEEPCNDPNFPRRLVLDTEYTRKKLGIEEFKDVNESIRLHVLRARAPDKIYAYNDPQTKFLYAL